MIIRIFVIDDESFELFLGNRNSEDYDPENDNMLMLVVIRFVALGFSLLVVALNMFLMVYFYRMTLFYISILDKKLRARYSCIAKAVAILLIIVLLQYLIADNLFRTVQYAISSLYFLIDETKEQYERDIIKVFFNPNTVKA